MTKIRYLVFLSVIVRYLIENLKLISNSGHVKPRQFTLRYRACVESADVPSVTRSCVNGPKTKKNAA